MKRTPLARGTKGLARTAMKRTATPMARTATKRKATADPITAATTAFIRERSGGYCEAMVSRECTGMAEHRHHRKLRRHGDHSATNLLYVCTRCHNWIHRNIAEAYRLGLLVKGSDDPAKIGVRIRPLAT